MRKIYLVTSGEYSDYGIDGVFTSKELAEKFIKSFNTKDSFERMNIETRTLNPYEKELQQGFKAYFVRMSKKGETVSVNNTEGAFGFDSHDSDGFDVRNNLISHVYAKDKKHAIKIVNEKRTKLIALNKYPQKDEL